MLIDTHAHLDFPDFEPDRPGVIRRAQEEGVAYIINVSADLRGCLASLELAGRYENIYASIGIHPHHAQEITPDDFSQVTGFIKNEKVVAIGEIGLDFYRNLSPSEIQKELFVKFLTLSQSAKLPVIIHSREAQEETLKILKENSCSGLEGVVHCFSGDRNFMSKCLDLGLYISFTCNITYKKSASLRELVKYAPGDRLLIETDCPYLPPEGLRGRRNAPENVKLLAQFIADLRGSRIEDIAKSTTENAISLFRLKTNNNG